MTNSLDSNLLYFDSAGTAYSNKDVRIAGIFWTEGDAAGQDIAADDVFELTDESGQSIIKKTAATAGDELVITYSPPGLPAKGIVLANLDGGICHVHLW
jgi:hypothetical protein